MSGHALPLTGAGHTAGDEGPPKEPAWPLNSHRRSHLTVPRTLTEARTHARVLSGESWGPGARSPLSRESSAPARSGHLVPGGRIQMSGALEGERGSRRSAQLPSA